MRASAIIILLIVTLSLFIVPTYASSITITVKKQQAQVQAAFALSLRQNITQLPNQNTTLDQSTNTQLSSTFGAALKQRTNATLTQLTVNIASTPQSLTVTTTMTLSNIAGQKGDIMNVGMGWKALNITSDLRTGDLSYNTIGKRYFRPVVEFYANASRLVGKPNATVSGVSFIVNGTAVGPAAAQNYAGNFTILDLSSLGTPLEKWQRTYSLSNDTTTWHTSPAQRLDLVISAQRQNRTTRFFATYRYDAEIDVVGFATAHGDNLIVAVGSGQQEWVMIGIVTSAIILTIIAQLSFRSRKKKYVRFGRW